MKEKEVIVIDENGVSKNIKQYCNKLDDKDLILLSNTTYDKENNIYHKYYDCYEDWPYSSVMEFKNWKIETLSKLENYKECARCMEREFKEKNPYSINGYGFHYYYEDL